MYKSKISSAIMDCYRKLYKATTPQGDFDILVKNARIDEKGQKHIDFMSYYLDEKKFETIIKNVSYKYNLGEYGKRALSMNIHLGASPTSVRKENE